VQDVVVWSDTEGAYAGLSVGVTDILVDSEANRAYYGRADATPLTILGGRMEDPYGNALGRVLGA
jgi:lipid-binding SYLF domain-containing protein